MSILRAETILRLALEAADRATIDAEEDKLSAREVGLPNEQWVQSYVGDAISIYLRKSLNKKHNRPYVTYETSVAWLEHFFAQKRARGRIAGKLSDRQRFDISVWPEGPAPVGLIEIKNEPIMSAYSRTSDPEKLAGALRRWNALRWGLFLFCIRNTTSKEGPAMRESLHLKANKTFDAIREAVHGSARASLKVSTTVHDDECQIMWAGVIIRRSE